MAGDSQFLKQGRARSVRVERRGERNIVVKRFEHSAALGRAFDRGRAQREFALLQHLAEAGVDVPRPLGLARSGRGHEVELEWIEGARSLAEVSADGARLGPRLARSLGGLLAGLHNNGVDHPDLHAGNVLVTAQDRAIAIDFDKARLVRALGEREMLRDLVSLCAGMRERSAPAWRALAYRAWWSALAPDLRSSIREPDVFAIEAAARTRRRRVVEQRARRFLRAGSAVRELDGRTGFARHDVDSDELARALRRETDPASQTLLNGSRRVLLAHWRSMARLEEHGIPAPRARVLLTSGNACACFARESTGRPATPDEQGRLLGMLLDRGLWCETLEPGDLDACGLLRPRCLLGVDPATTASRLTAWISGFDNAARRDFLHGVRAVWRGPRRERDALLASCEHG